MANDVRVLGPDDSEAAWRLGSLTFGYHATPMPDRWRGAGPPGRVTLGVFDSGRLVAKAVDRVQGHWFGGRLVPASGVAGVAVAPEVRGRGHARRVLTRLLGDARERGAVISTLFPSTPTPYRRLGWETVGALTYLSWPTATFGTAPPDPGVTLRPATVADVPAIQAHYLDVARAGNGMMDRTGPTFSATPAELLADYDGVTVAVGSDGAVTGYASWERGSGYDAGGKVTVDDLVGADPAALGALLSMLGGWASVAPTTHIRLSTPDPVGYLFPDTTGRVESRQPWMLRLVDAAGAVAARGWPAHLRGTVDLDLVDEECLWNAGRHRLVLDGGEALLEPGGEGRVRLSARGAGAWWAGAASPAVLRRAGLLAGETDADALLLAATAGPPPTLHDYF
jgi:predicted acetyltransferase